MENRVYIVDRIEEKFAVCETDDLNFVNIELKMLPKNIKEGDIIIFDGQKYVLDIEKTRERKKEIDDLIKDIWI